MGGPNRLAPPSLRAEGLRLHTGTEGLSVRPSSFILWDKQPLCGVHAGGLKSQGESHLMAYERVKGEPRHLCVL